MSNKMILHLMLITIGVLISSDGTFGDAGDTDHHDDGDTVTYITVTVTGHDDGDNTTDMTDHDDGDTDHDAGDTDHDDGDTDHDDGDTDHDDGDTDHDTSKFAYGTLWSINQETLPEEATLYSTRLPLKVKYFRDEHTFIKWTAPAHCSAVNARNVETEMSCSMAGVYRVRLQYMYEGETMSDSRAVILKNSPLCYRWYVLVERRVENADNEIVVKVWIWDPLLSGPEEMKQTASKPSKISETLTKLFAGKGQVPGLRELLPDPRFQLDYSNMTFQASRSMWEFYLRVSPCKVHRLQVSGIPSVASHGCFIRDERAVISSMCMDGIVQSEGSLTLKGQLGVTMVIKDPCNQDKAFLIMSGQCLFTMDGFKSINNILVSSYVLTGGSEIVKDIAITSDLVIYLLEEGSLLTQNRSSGAFMWLTDVSNLNAVEDRFACHHSHMRRFENEMFLGWDTRSIYIWHGMDLIQSIEVTKEQVSSLPYPFWFDGSLTEVFVEYVAFTNEPHELIVLVKLTSEEKSVSIIFKKDWTSDSWGKPLPFLSKAGVNTSVSLLGLHDSEGSMILWDEHSVYYCYAKGVDHGVMVIHNALESGETEIEPSIKQLTVTMDGSIIVLSSDNQLFTSQYYQKVLIRHSLLSASDSDLAVYTDYVDQLYTVQIRGSSIERTSYALKADMGSILKQLDHTECMFYHFKEGPQYEVYYMDVRDSAVIWAELVYSAHRYNDIQMVINRPEKLSLEERVMTDFNPGRKSVKKVLTLRSNFLFEENDSYEEALESATGLVTLEMRPRRLGIGCPSSSKMITELEMGCPPQRHIRIQKPEECEDYGTYIIDKKSYNQQNGEPATAEMVVEYDKRTYGCPITQTVKEVFKPEIDLYDEEVLVETMTANFVMWEDNRRHDFTYTASMISAGCLRVAQTWEEMKEQVDDDVPVKLIWGPHNYESCFKYEVTEQRLLQNPYQIMNHSGDNNIRWQAPRGDHLYLFTIHVVDPYYSFCRLEAKIAVIVSDERPVEVTETPLLKISLGTFAGLTGSVFVVTYFFYRRGHILDLALELDDDNAENTEEDNEEEEKTDE